WWTAQHNTQVTLSADTITRLRRGTWSESLLGILVLRCALQPDLALEVAHEVMKPAVHQSHAATLAKSTSATPAVLELLTGHVSEYVRETIAERPDCPPPILQQLSTDEK